MFTSINDFHASDEERIQHWEKCLIYAWEIPEPPEGWELVGRLRDEQGLNKYPICATFNEVASQP